MSRYLPVGLALLEGLPERAGKFALENSTSTAGLKVPHAFDLERAGPLDAEVFMLLTGQQPNKLVILTTQLLTSTHSFVLRAIQVRRSWHSLSLTPNQQICR